MAERVCQEREDSAPGAMQISHLMCDAFSCSPAFAIWVVILVRVSHMSWLDSLNVRSKQS